VGSLEQKLTASSPSIESNHSQNASGAAKFRQEMGQVSRQSAVFFAGTMFTAAAGYLFKIYVAHLLGAEGLGIYSLGMTVVGFFGVFATLGLPWAGSRFVAVYVARGEGDRLRDFLLGSFFLLAVFNGAFAIAMFSARHWIAVRLYHTPALSSFFPLFLLIMVVGVFTNFFGQVLTGFKQVARRTVITNFIGSTLTIIFSVALLSLGWGLRGYILAQLASGLLVVILLVAAIWMPISATLGSATATPRIHLERHVIAFCGVAFAMDVLGFVTGQADKVMLGFYLRVRDVGIYATATALVTFIPIILQSVNQIFSPTIADLHARNEHEVLSRLFQTTTKWILGLTVPLAAVVMIFSRPLMGLFGRDFEPGWPVLVIGTLGQLVNCGAGSVGYLLLMSGNQRRLIKVQVVMAGIMLAANLLLVPRWGLMGAATVGAAINVFTNLWCLREVRECLRMSPYNRSYLRLSLPASGAIVVTLLLRAALKAVRPQWLVILIGLTLAYLVFAGITWAFGLNADDQLIAGAAWSRITGTFKKPVAGV
jgi:O-antigen/teichoic acid export membrane protein